VKTQPTALEEELKLLTAKRRWRDHIRPVVWLICVALGFSVAKNVESAPAKFGWDALFTLIFTIAFSAPCEWFYLRYPSKEQLQELLVRIELWEKDIPEQQRAERLFKLHQIELKKYYDQALNQSRWVFYVGLGCLALGFLIIWGAYRIVIGHDINGTAQKTVVAVVGAIGSLLSSFIGAIYIRMYTETLKSLTAFHDRLVKTHHMHYGAYLVAKINNMELRNRTFSQMALGTISTLFEIPDLTKKEDGQDKSPDESSQKEPTEILEESAKKENEDENTSIKETSPVKPPLV
jgi:hypothetical protein